MPAEKKKAQYRVLNGLNIPGQRLEPGDVTDAIPAQSVGWLLEQGHIEPAEKED